MKHHFYSLLAAAVLVSGLGLASSHAFAQDTGTDNGAGNEGSNNGRQHARMHRDHRTSGEQGRLERGRTNEDMSHPEHGYYSNNAPNGTGVHGNGGNSGGWEHNRSDRHERFERHERMERRHEMKHAEKRHEMKRREHHKRHH